MKYYKIKIECINGSYYPKIKIKWYSRYMYITYTDNTFLLLPFSKFIKSDSINIVYKIYDAENIIHKYKKSW